MASITIRKLDEATKQKLRVRAANHKRSMEDEARHILREALRGQSAAAGNLADAIHDRFKEVGGVDLRIPRREPTRDPPRPSK